MRLRKLTLAICSLFILAGSLTAAKTQQKEKSFFSIFQKESPAYLYAYTTGEGEDGLHLAYSHDGIIWRTLNNGASLLKPTIGSTQTMRDPSIARDSKGVFHLVWATGSKSSIGYATSKDLINWSEQKELPLMGNEAGVENTSTPELHYDSMSKICYIVWSSTIPGKFPKNGVTEDGSNNRLYFATTSDFKTFSKTRLFYDPGFSVVDAFILKRKGVYHLFLKNETKEPIEKNIRLVSSGNLKSFPKEVSESISGKKWAKGPSAVQIGKFTYVYWKNEMDNRFGGVRTENLKEALWEDISDMIRFPAGANPGSAFKIENETLVNLQKLGKDAE